VAGSQNFSFLALNTAKLAAPQISSKNRRQRRVSSLACTQTDIDTFLTIFEENSSNFPENSQANSKKTKPEYAILYSTWQSMFMENFSPLACTQTDLGKFLTFFQEKIKIFLKKIWNFPNLKKI
jgi:hypothetical protein